jgi:hypothetical protein
LENFKNFLAYFFTGSYLAIDLAGVQKQILFIGAIILLMLQIILHILRIKNEKKNKN